MQSSYLYMYICDYSVCCEVDKVYREIEVENKDYHVSLSTNLSAARRYSHWKLLCSYGHLYLHITLSTGKQLL